MDKKSDSLYYLNNEKNTNSLSESHKQICLENFWQERVGMTLETAKTRMNTGFFARPYCS